MSFYWSCFAFNKGEVSIQHIKSWGVMTSSKWAEERDNLAPIMLGTQTPSYSQD